MSTAVKRACDACHRRKVKCDGINPCRNCSSAQLSCTYNAIPQKKGPKGSRAKVISELRETQRQTSLSAKVQNRMNGINSPPSSPSLAPTPGLLTSEMVKDCIEFFFANMYPTMPILHRQRLEQQAMYMDQSLDTYCLLTSLCAFMMIQPGMGMPGGDPYGLDSMPGANIVSGTLLMEETVRVRKAYDYLDSPTLNTLCTSYFLFGCYYGLDLHDKAWFHLREATTLAHLIGMNKEDTYLQYDSVEASRRRRLYWLLFVTERAYALQRHRPLTLQATINQPTLGDDPADPLAHHLNGFILLVNLFRPFDDAFVALWNKGRNDCSASYLSALQKQLNEVLPPYLNVADTQLADLRTNQQWLKTMTWQLSMNSGNLNSNGSDPMMSFQYPINIAGDVLSATSSVSQQTLELLGVPLLAKLFDIACALTDVLSLQPASRDPFTVGPREHLRQLMNLLSVLRNGDHRFMPLLLSKVHEVLPRLANPMLQNVPENACNVDIFDGFGNAGMAQPPVMSEYEKKFPVPRVEELSNESGSPQNGAPPSSNDMSSPFVSSPPILSPPIEFQSQGYGSMSDMVMSPMGGGPTSGYNQPATSNPQQPQQHPSMSAMQSMNAQLQNGMGPSMNQQNLGMDQNQVMNQGFNPNMGQGMANTLSSMGQMLVNRQGPTRANSYNLAGPQIRTIGDFHALQRANSDMSSIGSLGMNSNLGTELDFNTLR